MLDYSCIRCGVALSIPGCEIPTPETLEGFIAKGTGSNQRFWQTKFLEPKVEHQDTNPSISGTSRFDVPNIRSHGTAWQERLQGREFGSLDLKEAQNCWLRVPVCAKRYGPQQRFVLSFLSLSMFRSFVFPSYLRIQATNIDPENDASYIMLYIYILSY